MDIENQSNKHKRSKQKFQSNKKQNFGTFKQGAELELEVRIILELWEHWWKEMALKRNIFNFNFNFKHSTKGDTFQCVLLRAIEKVSSNLETLYL